MQKNLSPKAKRHRLLIIAAIPLFILIGVFYYRLDPANSPFMPRCLWYSLTGWQCPGCGAQRMAHALLHGNFNQAWSANPFLLCLLPVIPVGIWADLRPGLARRLFYHPATILILSLSIILWGLLRNIL